MLKNWTIAISSALLALSQVTAAPAATPLTTMRVASKLTRPLHMGHAPGDFDRAFVVQQTGEIPIQPFRFDLTRPNIFTGHDDQILRSACDRDVVLIVKLDDIAGSQPTIAVDDLGGLFRTLVVFPHHARASHPELAALADGDLVAGLVAKLDLNAGDRRSDGADLMSPRQIG